MSRSRRMSFVYETTLVAILLDFEWIISTTLLGLKIAILF